MRVRRGERGGGGHEQGGTPRGAAPAASAPRTRQAVAERGPLRDAEGCPRLAPAAGLAKGWARLGPPPEMKALGAKGRKRADWHAARAAARPVEQLHHCPRWRLSRSALSPHGTPLCHVPRAPRAPADAAAPPRTQSWTLLRVFRSPGSWSRRRCLCRNVTARARVHARSAPGRGRGDHTRETAPRAGPWRMRGGALPASRVSTR